nr:hypothetical protein [Ramlibacter cellulosilyticus]
MRHRIGHRLHDGVRGHRDEVAPEQEADADRDHEVRHAQHRRPHRGLLPAAASGADAQLADPMAHDGVHRGLEQRQHAGQHEAAREQPAQREGDREVDHREAGGLGEAGVEAAESHAEMIAILI